MTLRNASLRLFIQIGESSPDDFSKAAREARSSAIDTFPYKHMAFAIGERGSVYIDVDASEPLPDIASLCGRRIKWCRVITDTSQVHALTQSGHYTGRRLGCSQLKALIDKTGDLTGKPRIIVEGASVERVVELAALIANGKIAIKLSGEVIVIDRPN